MNNQNVSSNKKGRGLLIAVLIILVVLVGGVVGFTALDSNANGALLTYNLTEPLGSATAAKIAINAGSGNLTVDGNTGDAQALATGTLQYYENKGQPSSTVNTNGDQYAFTLKASGSEQPWSGLPWEACNGATDWLVHLNPGVKSDITAFSNGGNLKVDLAGAVLTRLAAETGGGNVDVILPNQAADLNVAVKTGAGSVTVEFGSNTTGSSTVSAESGAGNVIVTVPAGMAARIHASSGMGSLGMDSRFSKIDDNTYQSADYDSAANKVELTLKSGAGDVNVNSK